MLMGNAGVIHYALFWNENNGFQFTNFVKQWYTKHFFEQTFFLILYKKCYKFYNANLSVFLRIKQRETLKFVNPKQKDWVSIELLTLSFNFLVYFAKMSSYFSMKANKIKVRKRLKFSSFSNFYAKILYTAK